MRGAVSFPQHYFPLAKVWRCNVRSIMRTKNRDSPRISSSISGETRMYILSQYSSHLQHPHRILSFLSDGKTMGPETSLRHYDDLLYNNFEGKCSQNCGNIFLLSGHLEVLDQFYESVLILIGPRQFRLLSNLLSYERP